MIRVLHLHDAACDFETRRSIADLCQHAGPGHASTVRSIGPGGDYTNTPVAAVRLGRAPPSDLVHAWGRRALLAAALSRPQPLIFSPPSNLRPADVRLLSAVAACRDVTVVCPTVTQARLLARHGIEPRRRHVIRPGVNFARLQRRRDQRLREALGLASQDIVVLAAGESTGASGHDDAVWAVAILHVLDPRWRLLLWGRGDRAAACLRFAHTLGHRRLLVLAETALRQAVEFEQLLPAADMVLAPSAHPVPTLPVCVAMGAALPIVAVVTSTLSELLEDRHTALLAPPRSPPQLARQLLRMREDPSLQWRLADRARAEAYQYFALTRFLDEWRKLYAAVALTASGGQKLSMDPTVANPIAS